MTHLSVNLNKVATIRNTRRLGIPSVLRAATICIASGAHGITIHPRPDERHIRAGDVAELSELLKSSPRIEFNIEGNPFHNLMGFVHRFKPHQVTFVPDEQGQQTSDHGWSFPQDTERLRPLVRAAQECGCRVSLFMDAVPAQMHYVKELGAECVELYTQPYAQAFHTGERQRVLERFQATAQEAGKLGLGVNAGHDLNLENLGLLIANIAQIREVSIGHAFVADALERGYGGAVKAYLETIQRAKNSGASRDPNVLNDQRHSDPGQSEQGGQR
jgi:pyridoxine 5-phosphate synthase